MMRKLRTLRRGDAGATTMGLIITIIIVSTVAAAAVGVVINFQRTAMRNALESQASDAAASVFELANATPWADLALATGDPDLARAEIQTLAAGQTLVLVDAGTGAFEPIAAVVTGELENFGTINEGFTVYSAVTWENEPTVSIATGEHTGMFGTKRVSVMVKWGDGERESQTFSTLVSPTIAEAVPTNVNIEAGGGLDVVRDINAPSLTGDTAFGNLTATIIQAYRWEIQMSPSTSFSNAEVLCSGEYSAVKDSTEDCTYRWKESIGFGASFRVKVWTLDTNNAAADTSGIKYSNVMTFPVASLAPLTGGKIAWNQDKITWQSTVGLMNAEYDPALTVDTVVQRKVGSTTSTIVQAYNIAGDAKTFTAAEGESATYQVCTRFNGTTVACSGWYGPLYTVTTPLAPILSGTRSGYEANYVWSSNADTYTGAGGVGLRYDIQQLQGDNATWSNVALGSTLLSLSGVDPQPWAGYLRTTTQLRVRVQNDAGFSPWTYKSVTVGELPTAPSISFGGFWATGGASPRLAVRGYWTAASYAYSGWDYWYTDNVGRSGSGRVTNSNLRYLDMVGDDGQVATLRARGVNQFGVSAWGSNSTTFNHPPTIAGNITNVVPQQGKFWVSWATVPGATGYQIQYWVNGAVHQGWACGNQWLSYCTSALSATFDAYVHEGDRFQIRVRGYSGSGVGPWSAVTGSKYALMRSVSAPTVYAYPRTSGGLYDWANLACDTGSLAEYDVYETYWQTWMTRSYYYESFGYGYTGAAAIRQRCTNTTTGQSSLGTHVWKTVGWRLLPNNAWNGNMWRRLQQATSFSNPPGTNYGRPNQWTKYAYYSYDSKVLQNWMNAHDSGKYGNTTVDGYWGPGTTLKMQQNIAIRCGYWVAGTQQLDSATLSGLQYCLDNNRW